MKGSQRLNGQVVDESFFQTAHETIPLHGERQELESYFLLFDPSYYDFYYYFGDYLSGTANEYYAARQEGIDRNLQRAGLSDEEMAYWEDMAEQVETPFIYQSIAGPQALLNILGSGGITIILPLLLGVLLCELFSQEHRTRADMLIFSTRRGRFPLYLAKVLAGEVSVLLTVAIVAGAGIIANLLVYGTAGLSGAFQLVP